MNEEIDTKAVTEPQGADKKKKKKKDKDRVRSAWISFAGRILAQIMGATATVALTVTVLHQYKGADLRQGKDTTAAVKKVGAAEAAKLMDELSVAVLPMENYSEEPGHDSLADGITEVLIADLAKVDGLRVISRTSSMHFKGERTPIRDIAAQLGVKWIIEGSVIKTGGQVRITAQLIDAVADQHAWAETYDRPVSDLLAMQAEVAGAIANAVSARVPAGVSLRDSAKKTPGFVVAPIWPL
jgi:TolB-like protein